MLVQEYINKHPEVNKEILDINTIFRPFNITVSEVLTGAQSIKYILRLPLDINIQGKIKRAETNIKYTLTSAIKGSEFTYGHEDNYVYIERPADFKPVYFNSFSTSIFQNKKLNLVLGTDTNGDKLTTNLAKAPHILVAGTTGSGKSELLHTFVCSLIMGMPYTHAELLIIDPKRAEFSPYKNCKSIQVVTDMNIAANCLEAAVDIMEKRYAALEANKAKDIYNYTGSEDMHPIVIIIDELADLIMSNPKIESDIVRIAQKARACGIHLIIGTQSPRRDVVTGLIKANIPTKIALKTTNQVESRIILDRGGAEKLLGKGDMLFLANGSFEPIRLQSAYITEQEKIDLANMIFIDKSKKTATAPSTPKPATYQKPKRIGLIRTLINLWNVKPIMFRTDDYPPKI